MIGEVTVFQRSSSEHEVAEVIEWAREFIGTNGELDTPNHVWTDFGDTGLGNHLLSITLTIYPDVVESCEMPASPSVNHLCYEVCQFHDTEYNTFSGSDDEQDTVATAKHTTLPATALFNSWDHLILEDGLKDRLMSYAITAMELSDKGVDPQIISLNRVLLFHGPPGTGKTSLCRALAQNLAIDMRARFRKGHLIEINSHSLFSKWFSESGKLVMRLFDGIRVAAQKEDELVCVLIDEVESLTAARKSTFEGNEPSDALRVVNALLTQIDQIKSFSNVLILCTSNLSDAIDDAFVDRADVKQYIGNPVLAARYTIMRSCVDELLRTGILTNRTGNGTLTFDTLAALNFAPADVTTTSLPILEAARLTEGFSGRSLRKLPFLAYAECARTPRRDGGSIPIEEYFANLALAIALHHNPGATTGPTEPLV